MADILNPALKMYLQENPFRLNALTLDSFASLGTQLKSYRPNLLKHSSSGFIEINYVPKGKLYLLSSYICRCQFAPCPQSSGLCPRLSISFHLEQQNNRPLHLAGVLQNQGVAKTSQNNNQIPPANGPAGSFQHISMNYVVNQMHKNTFYPDF